MLLLTDGSVREIRGIKTTQEKRFIDLRVSSTVSIHLFSHSLTPSFLHLLDDQLWVLALLQVQARRDQWGQ